MLRNFDDVEMTTTANPVVSVRTETPAVVETVTVRPRSESKAYVAKADENWGWSDLRDYVVGQIEERFGVFPRDVRKEAGIFKSFVSRYGQEAPAIARFAFEITDGWWRSAPISITRFCKGNDPYFADPIRARLAEKQQQGW